MKKRRLVKNPLHDAIPAVLVATLKKVAEGLVQQGIPFVVVGGMALSYRFPTYPTDDVDVAVLDEASVPERIAGLKRLRGHMWEDRSGVIVDVVTPHHVRVPKEVFDFAFATATVDRSLGVPIRFASRLAIFAIKLCRARVKDQSHVMWMMRHDFTPTRAHLQKAGVPESAFATLEFLKAEHRREAREEKEMGW